MLKITQGMPVQSQLAEEGISFTDIADDTFKHILIVNIMPNKQDTERQLLRILGKLGLNIEVTFLYPESHQPKNTDIEYLQTYYTTFHQIKEQHYDALIITGAPVEKLEYEDVTYIKEIKEIIEWSNDHTDKRLFLCWSAQYALYHNYDIEKSIVPEKLFGVYPYQVQTADHPYSQSFGEIVNIPVSRHTQIDIEKLAAIDDVDILSQHRELGPDIIASKDLKTLYIFGHLEYESHTLDNEYKRDLSKGLLIALPENYYPENNPDAPPLNQWHQQAVDLYQSWLSSETILVK